jgi:hypothetical protein
MFKEHDSDGPDVPWTVKWISLAAVMAMPIGEVLGRELADEQG